MELLERSNEPGGDPEVTMNVNAFCIYSVLWAWTECLRNGNAPHEQLSSLAPFMIKAWAKLVKKNPETAVVAVAMHMKLLESKNQPTDDVIPVAVAAANLIMME